MLLQQKNIIPCRQQGMALIMALVILLILTILGITAMNTSTLQLLMTGNSQYQTVALNTAEDVIREAEKKVDQIVATKTLPASGYYDLSAGTPEVDLKNFQWANNQVIVQNNAKYIIEYAGDTVLDSASLAWRQNAGIQGDTVSVFRLTARAPAARGAMRFVQSIYVTVDSPL